MDFYDICIIGGGQSGLVTCKTFIEQRKKVIVLEKCDNCIGMFSSIQEKEFFKWSSSRYVSGFSDFPIPKTTPVWFTIQDYLNYLELYMKHFGLEKYINYNSEVKKCYQNQDKEWIVEYNKTKILCKKLIICTGLNQTPKFPELVNDYTGEIIHTEYVYRNMNINDWKNKFTGKRILLLGGAESAYDIGHIIVQYSDDVYYTTKNYTEWFPKGNEEPKNMDRLKKLNNNCLNILASNDLSTPTDTQLTYIEYSLPEPMSQFWHEYGRLIINSSLLRNIFYTSSADECASCSHSHNQLCKINETPNSLFKKYVVKRTEFLIDLHENKASVVYYPDKIIERTIYTKEKVIEDVDIIVCATGFKKQFLFLEKDVWDGVLIKKIIPEKYTNIAFIGYARPTMGSIAVMAEMQSWWLEKYWFDPSFKYTIRKPIFREIDQMNIPNEHINTIVNGCFYLKDMAKDLDIEPNMVYLLLTDFELFFKIYTGTCHTMVYRIHGYKKYDKSREVLLNTYIEFKKKSVVEKLYLLFFIVMHLCFIIFLIIFAFIVSRMESYLPIIKKYVKNKNLFFIQLSLFFIFIFYLVI
jgi:thioredoxin reductase